MTRRAVVIVALLCVLAPVSARAWHKRTPAVLQITPANSGAVSNPRFSGYRNVFFDTDADLLGNGSLGRQIFYFDLQERDKALKSDPRSTNLAVHQLTSGPGDFQRASSGLRGKIVAFDGRPGNVGPRQIFLVDRGTGQQRALTRGGADSVNATIDDGSHIVVFESQADLLGAGFAGTQIYRLDLSLTDPTCPYPCPANGNAGLTQITTKAGTSTEPRTSKGSRVIVFQSDADLLNIGEHQTQIYKVRFPELTTVALSHGPGASRNPSLARSGGDTAFESDTDLTAPAVGGTQIYLHRDAVGGVQRITSAPSGHSVRPELEANGRAIIFISTDDLLDNGSTGPQAFSYDRERGELTQITKAGTSTSEPTYSAGVFTSFLSDGDLAGTGTSGPALYLVNLFALGDPLP